VFGVLMLIKRFLFLWLILFLMNLFFLLLVIKVQSFYYFVLYFYFQELLGFILLLGFREFFNMIIMLLKSGLGVFFFVFWFLIKFLQGKDFVNFMFPLKLIYFPYFYGLNSVLLDFFLFLSGWAVSLSQVFKSNREKDLFYLISVEGLMLFFFNLDFSLLELLRLFFSYFFIYYLVLIKKTDLLELNKVLITLSLPLN
jgi:hypothetical protein